MKTGKSITELAQEIERQARAKVDYVADTRQLAMTTNATLNIEGQVQDIEMTDLAHRQLGDRLGIPAKYYDRMRRDAPHLLAHNANHWFASNPETRMVRTLDGRARAVLSNRYQRIDNHHVAEAVLPVLAGTPGIEIMSSEITESRLYIKAVTHHTQAEVKSRRVGDLVEAGVMVTNSEVGLGAIQVLPFFHFLVCTNGMVRNKAGLRAAHLGTKLDADDEMARVLADDTRKVIDQGVLLKVRDVVAAAMDAERFMQAIREMENACSDMIEGNPAKAIEVLGSDFGIGQNEQGSVLKHLAAGGDLSRYGLMNAVTRTAEDLEDYDRATEFEAIGGRILDLPKRDWQRIAVAA